MTGKRLSQHALREMGIAEDQIAPRSADAAWGQGVDNPKAVGKAIAQAALDAGRAAIAPRSEDAARLREAAQRVVAAARMSDVPGALLIAILALDDALATTHDTLGRGRVTNRRLDQRLKENRHGR